MEVQWGTRLAIYYQTEGGSPEIISPISQLSTQVSAGLEQVDSIEKTHIGYIHTTPRISFNLTALATGPVVAALTKLALEREPFDIVIQKQVGEEWTFETEVLTDCVFNSAAPSNITTSGVPTATFSGISLGITVADKATKTESTLPPLPETEG